MTPDILLLDLAMPRVPGMEVLRELSSKNEGLPTKIIVLDRRGRANSDRTSLANGGSRCRDEGSRNPIADEGNPHRNGGQYWIGREAVGDIVDFMRTSASGDKPPRNFGLTKREMEILATIVAASATKKSRASSRSAKTP